MRTIRLFLLFTTFLFSLNIFAQTPQVEKWRNGVKSNFNTIQAAINDASAGDIIRIRAGVYRENLIIENKNGSVGAPIIMEGVPGELVIIDGADASLQLPNSNRWVVDSATIYRTNVNFTGTNQLWKRVTAVSYSSNDSLLATYRIKRRFLARVRGNGILKDSATNTVRINLGGVNPNTIGLNIGTADGILKVTNSRNWNISNLTLKNAGFAGIYLAGAAYDSLKFDKIKVFNSYRGLSTEEEVAGKNVTITNCQFTNLMPRNWAWDGYNDGESASVDFKAPQRSTGVMIKAATNFEVRNCQINGWWDGMKLTGKDSKAHRNKFYNITDDMVELESNNSNNIRFYNNVGHDMYVGISLITNNGQSVYVYRNSVVCARPNFQVSASSPFVTTGPSYGYAIKMAKGFGTSIAKDVKIFNNSFYCRQMCIWSAYLGTFQGFEFYNNIFTTNQGAPDPNYNSNIKQESGAIVRQPTGTIWSNNLWNKALDLSHGTSPQTNSLFNTNPLFVSSQYANPSLDNVNLNLQSTSPAINAGTSNAITAIDSTVIIGIKDIGAFEFGGTPAIVGPNFAYPTETGDGLTARYYNFATPYTSPIAIPTTAPTLTRIDETVNFTWANSPASGINSNGFLATWSGEIKTPNISGLYKIRVQADDAIRYWFNDVLIGSRWSFSTGEIGIDADVQLLANKRYTIRIEYFDNSTQARVFLGWRTPGTTPIVTIPKAHLFSESNANFRIEEEDLLQASNQSNLDESFVAYPNPMSDELTIQINSAISEITNIQIVNTLGDVIITKNTANAIEKIDTRALIPGVYVVVVNNQRKVFVK